MPAVKNYLSLIKFSHTIFAMPFAFIGFFLGLKDLGLLEGQSQYEFFSWGHLERGILYDLYIAGNSKTFVIFKYLGLVVLCMIFARSAAMAFNRYLDRDIDLKNPRTAAREIPAGTIPARSALVFTVLSCLLFIATCYFINPICFYLSPVALAVILGYSYTKRFTPLCHFVLGLGLSLAPIGAYLAVTGQFNLLPILFSISVICWVSGFDIIYALQDEEFDKSQQLYSIPAWMGKRKALLVSTMLHILSAASVLFAGWYGAFGVLYWAGAVIFIAMLIYQHLLVKPNDLSRVNLAFMTTNGIASVFFAVCVILDLFLNVRF